MDSNNIKILENADITDKIVTNAAKFFSDHYGIWGPSTGGNMNCRVVQGCRIKMSVSNLKRQIIPSPESRTAEQPSTSIYACINSSNSGHSDLIGNVFATLYNNPTTQTSVLWITQLVVHTTYRHRGIAKRLLAALCQKFSPDIQYVGILSSQPFAIMSVLSGFHFGLEKASSSLVQSPQLVKEIMSACPVSYVREAAIRTNDRGEVVCADTNFFVDHEEPEKALAMLAMEGRHWRFGKLLDGHEYLAIMDLRVRGANS